MKNDVDHLPPTQQEELARATRILMDEFTVAIARAKQPWKKNGQVRKIVLFGSYERHLATPFLTQSTLFSAWAFGSDARLVPLFLDRCDCCLRNGSLLPRRKPMKVFDHFDRIRVINLAYRSDRRREMDRELAAVGLAGDPRVAYFAAIRPSDAGDFTSIGAHGVYASQKAILREAAAAKESVLILEDDCSFVPGTADRQVAPGWDIFYGGYSAAFPENLYASDIQGAHMMGFSRQGAQRVSVYLEQLRYEGVHPPIDAAYVWYRRANPDVVTEFAVPPLGEQRSSRSDIADLKWFDRSPLTRGGANALRRLRRMVATPGN